MLLFSATLPLTDVWVRWLTPTIGIAQIIVIRSMVMMVAMGALSWVNRESLWPTQHWALHGIRNITFVLAVFLWFFILDYAPLSDLYAIGFTSPIFASIGSVFALNERLSFRKCIGLLGGIIGTLFVIQPGFDTINPYLILAVLCSVLWAIAMIATKKLASSESPTQLATSIFVSFIPVTLVPSITQWVMPSGVQWLLLISLSMTTLISHFLLAWSYQRAPLTYLAPVEFSTVIFSFLFGWVFFNEPILWTTGIGSLLIGASALYTMLEG
ncbi:hypothetical protein CL648_00105 [bacterium]|nr:hypothetical protein [bacterium]|tara:strand:- start:4896 stop:5705 length:810 start_codon:yes stop_codon:yes gene_type:complete